MRLKNGRLELEIDERSGSIARIRDAVSGLVHFDGHDQGRDHGRLFRIMTPVAGRQSRYIDSHQGPAPVIEKHGDKVVMTYENLMAGEQAVPVTAEVHLTVPAESDEVQFQLVVHNHGQTDLTDMLFPWLGGWTGLAGKGHDELILGASRNRGPAYVSLKI